MTCGFTLRGGAQPGSGIVTNTTVNSSTRRGGPAQGREIRIARWPSPHGLDHGLAVVIGEKIQAFQPSLAEGVGFEPTRRFPAYTRSRRAPSTTRPPLLAARDYSRQHLWRKQEDLQISCASRMVILKWILWWSAARSTNTVFQRQETYARFALAKRYIAIDLADCVSP
jgi:hypothetical protein